MWDAASTNSINMITRDEAVRKIGEDARNQGLNTWKVFYNGAIVATPSDLPDMVDYSMVTLSAVLNQA